MFSDWIRFLSVSTRLRFLWNETDNFVREQNGSQVKKNQHSIKLSKSIIGKEKFIYLKWSHRGVVDHNDKSNVIFRKVPTFWREAISKKRAICFIALYGIPAL